MHDGLSSPPCQLLPGVPSGTNLLGLIQHLTGVEEYWFRLVFLGEDLACDMSMDVPAGVTRAALVTAYPGACTRSTARHTGHADILREQIDGATGL